MSKLFVVEIVIRGIVEILRDLRDEENNDEL